MHKRHFRTQRFVTRVLFWVTSRLVPVLMLTVLIALLSSGQVPSRIKRGKWSAAAGAAADDRKERIRNEINRIGEHEWAGEYYYGDGLGVNVALTVAPESGFVFTWHGCLGLYDRNFGNVGFEDGLLKLSLSYPNKRGGFAGIAPELYPVLWGDRHYLIPSDGVIEFCNSVNAGLEPCSLFCGRFLLRKGDRDKETQGHPQVPPKFLQYLQRDPLKADIISVEQSYVVKDKELKGWRYLVSTVTLNAGKVEGMLPGLELHAYDPPNSETAEVIEIQEHTSRARIVQCGTDFDKPTVGWRLSTRLIDRALPPK
jgi:hypothetical protein